MKTTHPSRVSRGNHLDRRAGFGSAAGQLGRRFGRWRPNRLRRLQLSAQRLDPPALGSVQFGHA